MAATGKELQRPRVQCLQVARHPRECNHPRRRLPPPGPTGHLHSPARCVCPGSMTEAARTGLLVRRKGAVPWARRRRQRQRLRQSPRVVPAPRQGAISHSHCCPECCCSGLLLRTDARVDFRQDSAVRHTHNSGSTRCMLHTSHGVRCRRFAAKELREYAHCTARGTGGRRGSLAQRAPRVCGTWAREEEGWG